MEGDLKSVSFREPELQISHILVVDTRAMFLVKKQYHCLNTLYSFFPNWVWIENTDTLSAACY